MPEKMCSNERSMIFPVAPGPMTSERLLRIRAVYEAAVDSPAAARQALLDHECKGDEELRQEVERLLGAREKLPAWLAGPLLGLPMRPRRKQVPL